MAGAMEHNPNRVIKMIQMGRREEILASATIWLCVSCETCITRCPNEVDIARMMDVLRQMAIEGMKLRGRIIKDLNSIAVEHRVKKVGATLAAVVLWEKEEVE